MEMGLQPVGERYAGTQAVNLHQAHAFLTALDEDADDWTFQTFDDHGAHNKKLCRILHGSLDEHADELMRLNELGAGVFVTINETNGKGRKKTDITRIRALYVDLDGAPLEPVISAPTPPHIVVQSSHGRFHAYWRVSDCSVDECESALKPMIERFNGDPACSDRSRVLRLPGFFHRKAAPFLVNMIESNPGEYSLSALDLQKSTEEYRGVLRNTEDDRSHPLTSSVGVPADCLPESAGERNKSIFQFARFLKAKMPEATKAELRVHVQEWHRLALPIIGTKDFSATWADFLRGWDKVKFPLGATLSAILKEVDMVSEMPASLQALGYGDKGNLLVRVCKQLQANAEAEPFFLGARQAGEVIDMHYTDAAKCLYAMVSDGVLELVKRGAGKKASRYRYIWPE